MVVEGNVKLTPSEYSFLQWYIITVLVTLIVFK